MKNLTPREREIAALVARGYRTKVVAAELGITYGTAKLHLNNIYLKLGISGRVMLAVAWVRQQRAEEIDWEPAE